MNLIRLSCLVCLFISPQFLFSQSLPYGGDNPYDLLSAAQKEVHVPKSPEVAAFEKYGASGINMFTGAPNISIPVYTIQGHEMSIPISLTYDASGIRVDQIATHVGLGWNLNFGGVVSRQTNHMVDDLLSGGAYEPVWDSNYQTFEDYVYDNTVIKFDQQHPDGLTNYIRNLYDDYQSSQADTQPDHFSFNVAGLSGTIIINYVKQGESSTYNIEAFCYENPDIKIEAGPAKQGYNLLQAIDSWTITNTDGTKYIFSAPEISWNEFSADPYFPNGNYYNYVREHYSAWHLTKIISPNGLDVFEFMYSTPTWWTEELERKNQKRIVVTKDEGGCVSNNYQAKPQSITHNLFKIKKSHLEKIKYNGVDLMTTDVATRLDLPGQKRITGLNFKDENGTAVLNVDFDNDQYFKTDPSQSTYDETDSRLLLKKVTFWRDDQNDPKKYAFDYIDWDRVPSRFCTGVDYWGYYNGESCSGDLTALVPTSVGWPFSTTGKDRSPNVNYTDNGTLEFITYPTGGKTKFIYEAHRGMGTHPDAIDGQVGGLRLRKTIDYTDTGVEAQTKYYFYNDIKAKVDDSTYSLGDVDTDMLDTEYDVAAKLQQPLKFWEKKTINDPTESYISPCGGQVYCNSPHRYYQYSKNMATPASQIVTYDSVSELVFKGTDFQGATVTEFYNDYLLGSGTPNEPSVNREILNGEIKYTKVYDDQLSILTETYNEYTETQITDSQYPTFSGVFIYTQTENQSGVMGCLVVSVVNPSTKKIEFKNQQETGYFDTGSQTWICTWDCSQHSGTSFLKDSYVKYDINKYSFKPQWKKLEQTINKTYHGSIVMVDTTSYDYLAGTAPDYLMVKKVRRSDSKGFEKRTELTYPQDEYQTGNSVIDTLVNRNAIANFIEAESYYDGVLTSTQRRTNQKIGTKTLGSFTYDIIRPEKIQISKGAYSMEDRLVYHEYDSYGNPQKVSQPDGTITYYIWGYHGKQLIAEIKHMPDAAIPTGTQSLINSAITASDADDDSLGSYEQALLTALDNLRANSFFITSQLSTFTYDPGIGVNTMTDPRGYRMYYYYDQHNRLERVEDADGNIVGENQYSYRVNN